MHWAGQSEAAVRAAKQVLVTRYLRLPTALAMSVLRAVRGRPLPGPDPLGNVVGSGIGDKVVLNQLTGSLCIKVYVRKKYPVADIPSTAVIPPTIEGIPTDVEEVGGILALTAPCTTQRRQRQRPAPAGISIGHSQVTAGTLGGLVRDRGRQDNGRRYLLSNHHVLVGNNDGQAGDAILQPSRYDGGRLGEDQLARLTRAVPLRFGGAENTVDAAIAEVEPAAVLADVCGLGPPRGTSRPVRDMVVLKHGRTTGLTKGIITDVDADIQVDYDGWTAFFVNSVVIRGLPETRPFSEGGDSGALIIDSQQRVCGLLFAGAQAIDLTFANPIQPVLRRLRVRLV